MLTNLKVHFYLFLNSVETCLDIYAKRDYIKLQNQAKPWNDPENGCYADLKHYCEQSISANMRETLTSQACRPPLVVGVSRRLRQSSLVCAPLNKYTVWMLKVPIIYKSSKNFCVKLSCVLKFQIQTCCCLSQRLLAKFLPILVPCYA